MDQNGFSRGEVDITGASDAAFEKLMATVGRVLFHWSLLDQAVIEDIRRLRAESGSMQTSVLRIRGSFSERLAEWRALLSLKSRRNPPLAEAVLVTSNQVERLRQKRNLIADHFVGASPGDEAGEPYIVCFQGERGANTATGRITQSELTQLIEEMNSCRESVMNIEALAYGPADAS